MPRGYYRPGGDLMVEIAPFLFVNSISGKALGLIAPRARIAIIDDENRRRAAEPKPGARLDEALIEGLPREARKPRPTDAEFDALKAKRDAALAGEIDRICAAHGWDRGTAHVHVSGSGPCYCDCPDGPCQHIWDGPVESGDNHFSATCSRCGTSAMSHDMRFAP